MTNVTKALTDAGFNPIDPTIHPRVVMSLAAREKHGKTHFSMTAPGPIALFNLDLGDEGVVVKFHSQKQIMNYDMAVPREGLKDQAITIWDNFKAAYEIALAQARTVVVDTATELWELLRIARFGQLTQVMPYQYGPVNSEFRSVIRDAFKATGTNVIFLHKMKATYINDKRTGQYERSGFGDMGYMVQVNATMKRHDKSEDRAATEFVLHVDDCRHNPGLIGMDLPSVLSNFPALAQMVIAGTTEKDWK
jgi:hypothetical protein